MAITTPATLQVVSASGLIVPPVTAEPLLTALKNLNYLWKWHRPPLVDVCPNADVARGRGTFVFPIDPSADSLPYAFETRLITSQITTVTVKADYCTAYAGGGTAWTNLFTTAGVATVNNVLLTQSDGDYAIPANAVALRFDVQAAAGNVAVHHLLVYPKPADATAGIQPSGFVPFDDGLLTQAGAPINTERLNRCKSSTLWLLADRTQQALSFLQRETGTPWTDCTSTALKDLPPVRVWFPYQGPTVNLHILCLADVDAGATADLIRVRQVGVAESNIANFPADGTINGTAITVTLQGSGAQRYADLAVSAVATAGNHTRLRAISAYWVPEVQY